MNRRFANTILIVSGTSIFVEYVWRTLIEPVFGPSADPVDFFEDYVPTGAIVAANAKISHITAGRHSPCSGQNAAPSSTYRSALLSWHSVTASATRQAYARPA